MFNATIEMDTNCYSKTYGKTVDKTIHTSPDTVGDCLVGIKGKLYSVMELKQDLLQLKSDNWIVTLDMCRDGRSRQNEVHVK